MLENLHKLLHHHLKKLFENGQIATQYVNFDLGATNEFRFNPNGSSFAIEGIVSPDGRIFGKMGQRGI